MIKAAAKNVLANYHLLDPARRLRRRIKRPFRLSDRAIGARYLAESDTPRLHIGCGEHLLSGWLNTDHQPELPMVMHLDASQHFPFREETFDYIFSEHVIEHISYRDGVKMLAECFRVLKRSGKVRISTPDLAFLIDLARPDKSELQRAYIKWAVIAFTPGAPDDNEAFIINNFVRNWGHTFIYDEKTLRGAMASAGLTAITKCDLCESTDAALRNLENKEHVPPNFLRLETLTLEGGK
jgi:predicted SAM-dependent methyltransferase